MSKFKASFLAVVLTTVFVCVPQLAQAQYQTRNLHLGVSGGNVKDHTQSFCCSGTLGSLVTDGTTKYILSNNHVLARQDRAVVGEHISQPGLIDNGCSPATIVADFTKAVTLGNNVDCAVAALRAGKMDSTGFIEGLGGPPSSTTVSPSVGLAVAKSGRTTGHTTGTIGSINTSVNVQYQIKCGQGRNCTFFPTQTRLSLIAVLSAQVAILGPSLRLTTVVFIRSRFYLRVALQVRSVIRSARCSRNWVQHSADR